MTHTNWVMSEATLAVDMLMLGVKDWAYYYGKFVAMRQFQKNFYNQFTINQCAKMATMDFQIQEYLSVHGYPTAGDDDEVS